MRMYSVYDEKAAIFAAPFIMKTAEEAKRAFASQLRNEESNIAQWPEDYSLFELGEYSEMTGQINCHKVPKKLCRADEYAKPTTIDRSQAV